MASRGSDRRVRESSAGRRVSWPTTGTRPCTSVGGEVLFAISLRLATDDAVSPAARPQGRSGCHQPPHVQPGQGRSSMRPAPTIWRCPWRDLPRDGPGLGDGIDAALAGDGTRLPSTRVVTLRVALWEAIVDAVAPRSTAGHLRGGEPRLGRRVRRLPGLTELLPPRRLFNAPISEAAIVGSAVGYAMAGGRALVELMYGDFIGRAGDELSTSSRSGPPCLAAICASALSSASRSAASTGHNTPRTGPPWPPTSGTQGRVPGDAV